MNVAQRYNRSVVRLLLANLLIKPIWILGIDRWVQREVGLEAYGYYYSVWGLALTAGFLLDLGLTTLIQREGAASDRSSDKLAGLFWVKALLLLLYFSVISIIAFIHPGLPMDLFFGVAILQALNSLYVYLRAWVTSAQDFAADVWFSVLDKGLLIPLCLFWLLGFFSELPIKVSVFILLQGSTLFISLVMLIGYLRKKQFRFIGPFDLSWSSFQRALPYALIVLFMSAHTRLDGFFLTQWSASGAWEAGRYAAGYRLLDAANIVGYLVTSFLLPYLSRHAHKPMYVRSAIDNARTGLLLFSLFSLIVVIALSPYMDRFLSDDRSAAVADLLPLLFSSILGYSLVHVYGTVLTARGDLRIFLLILAGALLLHVLWSVGWIPIWGAMGSARATLLTQVLAGVLLMYVGHRRMGLPQPHSSYLVVIFTTSLILFFF